MSVSYDLLKEIVSKGSNLVISKPISYDVLKELVHIAVQSGSKITIPANISYDLVRDLASIGKGHVTFVNE